MIVITDNPSLPGGVATFAVTPGNNSITVDSVDAGTGLRTFAAVHVTNAIVTIPPFTPGTFSPVTATYTVINPALPVDITFSVASQFHGILIRLRFNPTPAKPELDEINSERLSNISSLTNPIMSENAWLEPLLRFKADDEIRSENY